MYFLFLTYEIKCGATGLNIADRQNAYSMTFTVKGVVELYKIIKRKKKFYRQIFAFSFSYDYKSVKIYGYYITIIKDKTAFYRYFIYEFSFSVLKSE